MKKKIAAVLALVMAFGSFAAFAGCGKQYTSAIDWDVDLSKPIALKGYYPKTGIGAFGHDDSAKIIEEKTGYKVTYDQMGANADDDVQKALSNREKYHFMKLTEAQYHPYLENGTFLDLTELLENTTQGKILYQLIDLMDYGWDAATFVDEEGNKHIYGIPDFGYVCMTDSAMVWNLNHLEQIGFAEQFPENTQGTPETLSEVTWALEQCQEKFGSSKGYSALGIPGNNSNEITQIKGAFEVPLQFYVAEDGRIQQYIYSENVTKYTKYMNKLRHEDVIAPDWQSEAVEDLYQRFAKELHSCAFISYWHMIPLINTVQQQGKIAKTLGLTQEQNNYEYLREHVIGWSLRVRGDGSDGSYVQEKAMIEGGDAGVSYYTVIPHYMAKEALYIIDFLAKKMEYFEDFYGGTEGTGDPVNPADPSDPNYATHWYEIEAPEGAPAASEYTPERDEEFSAHEDFVKRNIFLRPYSYSYDSTGDGVKDKTVSGGGKWIHLTDRYIAQINDNSQYCNGTNVISARALFHLREVGFNAWQVVQKMDDTIITNPMAMAPPFKHWAPVSILARTMLKNSISSAIDSSDPEKTLNSARQGALTKRKSKGSEYFYWSEIIRDEMTDWYNNVKNKKA